MDQKGIVKLCKESGCCDGCCLRFLGLKNPNVYEDIQKYIVKFQDQPPQDDQTSDQNGHANGSPQPKRRKPGSCVTCLGVLQPDTWPEACDMVKDVLERKRYECLSFACALSAPIATILRERAVALSVHDKFSDFNIKSVTPLKEAWKWSFGNTLATHLNMALDSGAVCPLLITVSMEYPDDIQELEVLKTVSPDLFDSRSKQKRFTVEFTRRSVEQALEGVTASQLREGGYTVEVGGGGARCISVTCSRSPLYLGGRYVKLSRSLPQTPWLVQGKRMMESSVQEIIFEPLAKLFEMAPEEAEHRLKFMSAGREDVDVRCLGTGRPFAIEITDPRRELTETELQQACDEISRSGTVVVKSMVHIPRDHLTQLKQGEETKRKTYEALCVKLSHAPGDDTSVPPQVTPTDITNMNNYRNTSPQSEARIQISQRTPLRVLHRRPLLTRTRCIYELTAATVPDHPALFTVRVQTEAGTYIKEWAHSELGRSRPALREPLAAALDILALDVTDVHLRWP